MGERRSRAALSGWLVLDKPAGITSAAAVSRVRRLLGAPKIGHGGTLDPLATGILPMAIGEATKTVSYVVDGRKVYRFTVRWGEQRDTDDADGQVIATSDVRPTEVAIGQALSSFCGEIEQVPPIYSAIKVAGTRAYALARASQPVELASRIVTVDRFVLLGCPDADHADFEVAAGKGVYMRALARDLATALGTLGHITALRRCSVGPFDESRAITLDRLQELVHTVDLKDILLPVAVALADIPALLLTEAEASSLQHGRPVAVLPVSIRSPLTNVTRDSVVCAMAKGRPVALAQIRGGEIRPLRILNL